VCHGRTLPLDVHTRGCRDDCALTFVNLRSPRGRASAHRGRSWRRRRTPVRDADNLADKRIDAAAVASGDTGATMRLEKPESQNARKPASSTRFLAKTVTSLRLVRQFNQPLGHLHGRLSNLFVDREGLRSKRRRGRDLRGERPADYRVAKNLRRSGSPRARIGAEQSRSANGARRKVACIQREEPGRPTWRLSLLYAGTTECSGCPSKAT